VIRLGDTLLLFHDALVPPPADHPIDGLLGTSDAARALRFATARAARSHASVLILGESGAGKELVARALGAIGRPARPFVAFNAAAVPPALVDSTLFGHVRGAFTDAREARPGLFRSASGGTLFLDEIGDLAPETQVRLLRVIEERAVVPVGGVDPCPVDCRLVAATHRDLAALVADGRFRGDLYARIEGVVVRVPPLRDRREDVPLLAFAFAPFQPAGPAFTASAMTRLMLHPWPFNVRELRSVVEQAFADRTRAGPLDLPPSVLARLEEHARLFGPEPRGQTRLPAAAAPPIDHPVASLDRAAVEAALARARGNMTEAASSLGKDRAQFYRIVGRLGLDPEAFR